MPRIVFFKETNGSVPFLEWFNGLSEKAQDKCTIKLERLESYGHELRRPEADYLKDGIYELRIRVRSEQYRILYFFHGRTAVVISHGIQKEKKVPVIEIKRAVERKARFEHSPEAHWHQE